MKFNIFFPILLFFLLSGNLYPTKAEIFTTLDGHNVEIKLVPDKKEILIDEPMWFSLEIKNLSDVELGFVHGGDYRNKFGRFNSFSISAIDLNGVAADEISSGMNKGGGIYFSKIPVGETHKIRFLTSHWLGFENTGSYFLTCKKEMIIKEANESDVLSALQYPKISIEVKTTLKVSSANYKQMGVVIDSYGQNLFSDSYEKSIESIKALSFIDDKRVTKYFVQLVNLMSKDKNFYQKFNFYAFRPLAKFNDNRAFEAIIKHIKSPDYNIRREVSLTLSTSKHPKAKGYLLSMRNDEIFSIRLDVTHYLGKQKSAESTAILKTMLDDKNEWVRNEAKRYLIERGVKLN